MSYIINQKIVCIMFSLLSSPYVICAHECPLMAQAQKHLDIWHAINKSVLSLPSHDITTFFMACLSVEMGANFLGHEVNTLINSYKKEDKEEECKFVGYLAHRFNWREMQTAIHQHYPSMYFRSMHAPDRIKNYINEHFQTLQTIHVMLQDLADCKLFMTAFLALLMCEKKKQAGVDDWRLLNEFQKVFADEVEVGMRALINMFGLKGILNIMDNKSMLATDQYLAQWRACKGKVFAEQIPLFFKGIALHKVITYAKSNRCLYALMPITNEIKTFNKNDTPPNRILNLSNQYLNCIEGIQDIPSRDQWQEININNNLVDAVPNMDAFVNLRSLSLSDNRLTIFPAVLKKLRGLKYLELCDNHIKSIPDEVQDDFEQLETLILARNAITQLPQRLCFKKLTNLDVSDNEIKKMPQFVDSQLRSLKIKGNPLAHDIINPWTIEDIINKTRKDGNTFHVIC